MLFDKINRKFNIQTIVFSQNWKPLLIVPEPYEERYPFWQLFYVSRGTMQIVRESEIQTVKSGEVIFRPPNQTSTMIYEKNSELYLGIIDFICKDKAMEFFGTSPISLDQKERKMIGDIVKEASEFYKDCDSNNLWPELISSSLEHFLIRLYGRMQGIFSFELQWNTCHTRNNISDKVNQINLILEKRRFENITIEEIASMMHESPNAMMKYYKKEMNESVIDHFLNLKLQTAMQLISESKMNFTEISEVLGFSSVNYFSKFFKKRTGMTLTEFSKQI